MKIMLLPRKAEEVEQTWDGVTKKRMQQWCVMEVDGLPSSFYVSCEPGKELPPGEYELDPKSFTFQNGRLGVNRPVLRPVAKAVPVAKA